MMSIRIIDDVLQSEKISTEDLEVLKNNEKLNDWFIEMDKLKICHIARSITIFIRQINRLKLTGKI